MVENLTVLLLCQMTMALFPSNKQPTNVIHPDPPTRHSLAGLPTFPLAPLHVLLP